MVSVVYFVFEFSAEGGGSLPLFAGAECRGAFLGMVRRLDSGLSELLHSGRGGRSVFSLKPLRFLSGYSVVESGPSVGGVVFERGARCSLEVAVFDEEASRRLVSIFATSPLGLEVNGVEFGLVGLSIRIIDPSSVISGGDAVEALDVRFLTPTYFNPLRGDQGYKVLYPDPEHLFASLVAVAHDLTGQGFPRPSELADKVYISGLEIRTPRMEASKPAPNGFTGWVRLRFKKNASTSDKKLIAGLLKLGEITNVGGNRTAGYGVINVSSLAGGEDRVNESQESGSR
jgi:CRISPR-associated endoribonuclease Cas6